MPVESHLETKAETEQTMKGQECKDNNSMVEHQANNKTKTSTEELKLTSNLDNNGNAE